MKKRAPSLYSLYLKGEITRRELDYWRDLRNSPVKHFKDSGLPMGKLNLGGFTRGKLTIKGRVCPHVS